MTGNRKRSQRSLGWTVRDLREKSEMSQAKLAAVAELSQGYLSQIENDEVQHPSARILFRIAQALKIDPNTLLEAAGYTVGSSDGYSSLPIDLPLMRYLAKYTPKQQKRLLAYLLALEDGVHERESKIGAEH